MAGAEKIPIPAAQILRATQRCDEKGDEPCRLEIEWGLREKACEPVEGLVYGLSLSELIGLVSCPDGGAGAAGAADGSIGAGRDAWGGLVGGERPGESPVGDWAL